MADDTDINVEVEQDVARALIERAGGKTPGFIHQYFNHSPEGTKDFNEQFIRPAILPTGLSIAGGMVAGAPGSAIGSGIGEAANQALGITDPSLTEIGKAVAVPAAFGAAGKIASKVAPFVLPSRVAQALNVLGPQAAAEAVGKLQPNVTSSKLFGLAAQSEVKVPMNRAFHAIDSMLDDLTNVSTGVQKQNGTVINYLKGLREKITTSEHGLDPIALQRELEGAGKVLKGVKVQGGSGEGAIKKVFGAMVKDLDDAAKMGGRMNPGNTGVQALIDARQAFKREKVLEDIGDAINKATRSQPGQGDVLRFDASKIINKIRNDERLGDFYKQAFTDAERQDLEHILYTLNKIPVLRPGAGQQFGSGKMLSGAVPSGGLGYAASGGDPFISGLATAAGAALPAGIEIGKDVALAMQLKTGRALVKELLNQSKGSITPQVASVIGAYAAAVRGGQVND